MSLISDNLLAAAHLVSRIDILFLAAVPPKLMAKDKKDSSSPERAMDERRGEETKAVKTELQKKSTKWGRNGRRFMSFVWKQRDSRLTRKKKTKQHRQRKCSCNFGHPCGGDNMCQSSLFDLENESAGPSVQVHLASAKGGDTETDGARSDNMPNSH